MGTLLIVGTYVNKNEMSIWIFATCLLTSSIKDKPHELNGNLNFKVIGK